MLSIDNIVEAPLLGIVLYLLLTELNIFRHGFGRVLLTLLSKVLLSGRNLMLPFRVEQVIKSLNSSPEFIPNPKTNVEDKISGIFLPLKLTNLNHFPLNSN
ncbi:MAG: hypothetical protein ACEQSF_03205 [Solirubrobacteraceae bacterium]